MSFVSKRIASDVSQAIEKEKGMSMLIVPEFEVPSCKKKKKKKFSKAVPWRVPDCQCK